MKKFYRTLLKQSYQIVKRYRFLWFFGVFAAIMGNGGEIQMLFRSSDTIPNLPTNLSSLGEFLTLNTPTELLNNTWLLIRLKPEVILPTLFLFLLIFLFVIWLIMVSQASIIYGVSRINNNKVVNFRNSFSNTYKLAWPVFLLNFFTRFILYGTLVILVIPFSALLAVNNNSDVGMIGIILLAFIITIPLAIIMNFILKYALVFLVVDKEKTWPAFIKAFRMFWKYWFVSIEMGIIMFFINILVGLAVFILLFFLMVPFIALVVLFAVLQQVFLANVALILVAAILVVLIVLAGSWLAVFQYSTWTLLFFEIKRGRAYPKLMRLMAVPTVKKSN